LYRANLGRAEFFGEAQFWQNVKFNQRRNSSVVALNLTGDTIREMKRLSRINLKQKRPRLVKIKFYRALYRDTVL
jgi:hypothetical protein